MSATHSDDGRTPCQANPELWLSDFATERAQAAEICKAECWRKLACYKDGIEGDNTWGVWGGVDLSRVKLKPRQPAASVCQNPECGVALMYDGTRRRFCKDTCQQRAGYLKKRAAVA